MWEAGGSRAQPSFGEAETLWQVLCSAFHILALGKLGHSWFRQSVLACCAHLIISVHFFLPSACEWNVVGMERQHRKAEYSAAWTLSVEAWKLGLDWYGSSTLHAATVGFILKTVRVCQCLPNTAFSYFCFLSKHIPRPFIPLQVILSNFFWRQLVTRRRFMKKSNKYTFSL